MKERVARRREKSSGHRPKAPVTLSRVRSAISNGSTILADVDHRSAWMRRLRDLCSDHASDLGGEPALSAAELVLIRRASMLTLQLELMEQRFAQNDEGRATAEQLQEYGRATNTLRRVWEALGIQRRPKDVSRERTGALIEHIRGVAS